MEREFDPRADAAGFTLLELLTVVVIVFILITMLVPAFKHLLGKADKQSCVGNLKGLYTAASAYVQDQGEWPQIPTRNIQRPDYAEQWIRAFRRYGIAEKNWLCPTVQRQMGNPDTTRPGRARVDYLATPFGPGARTPFQWPTQPWFVERGDVHGDGQMLIFTNSEVKSLHDLRHQQPTRVESFP